MPKVVLRSKSNIPVMAPAEISQVLTATGMSPIAFSRLMGVSLKLFMSWWDGSEPIPMIVARLMRVLIRHPDVIDYFKEVRVIKIQ